MTLSALEAVPQSQSFLWRCTIRYVGRLAAIVILSVCCLSIVAQGTIRFNNRIAGQIDGPVFLPDFATGPGSWYRAQLFLVTGTGASTSYTPLYPGTTFHDASINPLLTRYVVEPEEPVIVPGIPPGAQATVVMRAWCWYFTADGEVEWRGESAPVTVTLGGTLPSGEERPPAPLVGLQGFAVGPLTPPTIIVSATRQSNNWRLDVIRFGITQSYAVESTTDFVNWSAVLTNQTAGTVTIPIQSSNTAPVFFRLRGERND